MSRRRAYKAADLFAGCGGLTTGLKQAGFNVVGAVEIDKLAATTYLMNHPTSRVWCTDIRRLSARSFMNHLGLKRGELDLLAGCPPCQGFSRMRTLNGSNQNRDPQNRLLFELLRFVKVLRPKSVMLENVPRLINSSHNLSFVRALRRMGYRVKMDVLDVSNFGVPQRRRRFILIAALHRQPAFAPHAKSRKTVRSAIGHLPHPRFSRDPLHRISENRAEHVIELIRAIPRNGGSRMSLPKSKQLRCHIGFDGFRDVYGRMRWQDVAPTITGSCINPSKGRFLHPSQNRAISLREAALLQSFPARYRFSLERGKFAAAQMIGNALPAEFIRRHASRLRALLAEGRREEA